MLLQMAGFSFEAEKTSQYVCIAFYNLFIDGHLGYAHILSIVNNTAMWLQVQRAPQDNN